MKSNVARIYKAVRPDPQPATVYRPRIRLPSQEPLRPANKRPAPELLLEEEKKRPETVGQCKTKKKGGRRPRAAKGPAMSDLLLTRPPPVPGRDNVPKFGVIQNQFFVGMNTCENNTGHSPALPPEGQIDDMRNVWPMGQSKRSS